MVVRHTTRFAADNALNGTEVEKVNAYDDYISCFRKYTVSSDTVTHYPEVSLYPNYIGKQEQKKMDVSGDTLTIISAPIALDGAELFPELAWIRVH